MRQQAIAIFLASGITLLFGNAIIEMVFGALGKTTTSDGWSYVLALYLFLSLNAIVFVISSGVNSRQWQKGLFAISGLLSGALGGFFYGGISSENNPQIAIISAIAVSLIFACLAWFFCNYFALTVRITAGICAYSFGLILGIQCLSLLAVGAWLTGAIWAGVCLLFFGLTMKISCF